MGENIKTGASVSTYYNPFQGCDYTLIGADLKYSKDNYSVSSFVGAGTDFKNNTECVLDLKSLYSLSENINTNLRFRIKAGDYRTVFQVRISPFSTSFKLNDKTNVYTNLNDCITYRTDTKKIKNQVNFFGGVSYKVSKNISVWGEAEVDDLYRAPFSKSNISFNGGVNFTF